MKGKNPVLRAKCCQYLLCILCSYPATVVEKYTGAIDEVISTGINEASADARSTAKECHLQYSHLLPAKAQALLSRLSASAQKAIMDSAKTRTISGELPRSKPASKGTPKKTTVSHKSPLIGSKGKAPPEAKPNPKRRSTSPRGKKPALEPIPPKSSLLKLSKAANTVKVSSRGQRWDEEGSPLGDPFSHPARVDEHTGHVEDENESGWLPREVTSGANLSVLIANSRSSVGPAV